MVDLTVREADRSDEDAARRVCLATSEEDYLLEIMDAFLESGRVFLAFVDDAPAGVVKVELAMDGSSWLSGLRVVPSERRRGVGAAMCGRCEEFARASGSRAIRLWTGAKNAAANSLFASLGYGRVGAFTRWWARVAGGHSDAPTPTTYSRDMARMIRGSRVYRDSRGYVPLAMRFCRLSDGLLRNLEARDRLFLDSEGGPCALDLDVWCAFGRKVVELTVLGDDIAAQVVAASCLASESGMEHIGTFLPHGEPWSVLATREGLSEGEWGTRAVLYEKGIGPDDGTVIRP